MVNNSYRSLRFMMETLTRVVENMCIPVDNEDTSGHKIVMCNVIQIKKNSLRAQGAIKP